MNYTIYSKSDGQIVKNVSCPNSEIIYQFDKNTCNVIEGNYSEEFFYFENDQPTQKPPKPDGFYEFDINTKQWVLSSDLAKSFVLPKRMYILLNSDWTQLPNCPLTPEKQQEWAQYRQQIRDITTQSGYPFNVDWPVQPQG